MRKVFSFWLLLALSTAIVVSNSCGNTSTQKENAPEQEESSNNSDNSNNDVGVIAGDVLYKGIEVSRIFDEQIENTLGTPSDSRGLYRFYDGLEIACLENTDSDGSRTEYVDVILGTNLSLFTINGVSLDKNRTELIAAFGSPIEYYEYPDYVYRAEENLMMRYHVSNFIFDYMIDFWFDHPDNAAYNMNIKRIGQ